MLTTFTPGWEGNESNNKSNTNEKRVVMFQHYHSCAKNFISQPFGPLYEKF